MKNLDKHTILEIARMASEESQGYADRSPGDMSMTGWAEYRVLGDFAKRLKALADEYDDFHPLTLKEDCKVANANFKRVEAALAKEVERDAKCGEEE